MKMSKSSNNNVIESPIPCCTLNLDDLSADFVAQLPTFEHDGSLLIRSITDECNSSILLPINKIQHIDPNER